MILKSDHASEMDAQLVLDSDMFLQNVTTWRFFHLLAVKKEVKQVGVMLKNLQENPV